MYSIRNVLEESARANGIQRVFRVKLLVGSDSAVLPEALQFAFAALKREPLTPDAVLEIEARPGRDLLIEHYEGEARD